MSRIIDYIEHHVFEIILIVIVFILCATNYTPGTFLTGWDNLHPEFNIWANIKRSIFSTWQEYQGLGLLAGMAHASDLVRQLIILPFIYLLPTNTIRYLWHFGMLFLGTLGIFKTVLYITKNKLSAFISSLFYLLNFASVQYFYLAFDPYSTFWGFFPWLIYYLLLTLDNPKHLKKLFLVNLLATPSFYVQTLFVVYFISTSLILILHPKKIYLSIKILLIILAINSFWLLPNIYFTITRVSVTQDSHINQMVTSQFAEQNLSTINIRNIGLLQGQYFTLPELTFWQNHFKSISIQLIGYGLTIISLLGIFVRNKYTKYFITILAFCTISFALSNLDFIPLFSQIFRNSFTKLLVPIIFSLALLLGIFLSKVTYHFIQIALIPLILFYSWPSFTGNFFSPQLRNQIPVEYFELFSYLKTQPSNKRMLILPEYNYWGWHDYKWGLSGSGFLWYGIDQPITDRTFDVWDSNLENFYWQLKYAINSQNPDFFNQIINKYNISYILFDSNIYFPESNNSGKTLLDNQKIIENFPSLILEKDFGNLKLYSTNPLKSPVSAYSNLPNINQPGIYQHQDFAYTDYSNYQTNPEKPYIDSYPNDPLFSNHFKRNPTIPDTSNLNWQNCSTTDSLFISAINQITTSYFSCSESLKLDQSYIVKINSKNISGQPPQIKIFSLTYHRLLLDSKLNSSNNIDYFIIPQTDIYDSGIGINLSSASFSQKSSSNQIISVEIAPINWQEISSSHSNIPTSPSTSTPVNTTQFNQAFYQVRTNSNLPNSTLVLPQSFSPGWLAISNGKILPHFLVNNWSNGWTIPDHSSPITVYLFFWPQLLQFFGFGLLIGTFIWILRKN